MTYTTDSSPCVKIASYNLHGFNQGAGMLLELCASFDVIFCEEHWLTSDQLVKINNLSRDFHCISMSAVDTGYHVWSWNFEGPTLWWPCSAGT